MATNVERQRHWKQRQTEKGLVQINGWLPPVAAADFQQVAEWLRNNPEFTFGQMRSATTGRQKSWRRLRSVD